MNLVARLWLARIAAARREREARREHWHAMLEAMRTTLEQAGVELADEEEHA